MLYGGGTGASLISGWAGVSPLWRRTIPLSTLDVLLGKRLEGKRLLIKMDVEGVEYHALQGALQTLSMFPRPVWIVEIGMTTHHPKGFNPNYVATFELFRQYGYRARTAEIKLREISWDEVNKWATTGVVPEGAGNFLFESNLKSNQ